MKFLLDIDTLLQVLQEYRIAHARLLTSIGGRSDSYRVEIVLHQGTIVSCTLHGSSGARDAQGKEALQMVQRSGTTEWSVVLDTPLVQKVDTSQAATLPIPHRCVDVLPPQQLSRLHRNVFALVDGQRDVFHISQMLSRSQEMQEIEQVFSDLRALGVIDF
jgi:hypothetical protein